MLKKLPAVISPEMLKCLAEMGHGDEIVIADANFPGASVARRLIRCDGIGIPGLLEAVMTLLPLDDFVEQPVALMAVGHGEGEPGVWEEYRQILQRHEAAAFCNGFEMMERFAFYERAKNAYAVIQSGERALYANILLKKGVVRE